MNDTALRRAIQKLGTQSALAAALGVRSPSVSGWHRNGVPEDKCAAIEAATAGAVRCEDLRPDVEWTRDAGGRVTGYHVRVAVNLVADPVAAAPAEKVA